MEKKYNILIVDDMVENIKILIELLKSQYNVFFAKSGVEAISLAVNKSPDLILLDIIMPDMDGYTVCKHLKNMDSTVSIPIIFISAMTEVVDEEKGLMLGAVDYITKPFSPSIVLARIKTHLGLSTAIEELRVRYKNEIDMKEKLKIINNELVFARKMIDDEIDKIVSIQKSLLPNKLPNNDCFSASAFYEPCLDAGGDYYDIIALDEKKYALCMSDVSGHGAHAAVIMAMTRMAVNINAKKIKNTKEFLIETDRILQDNIRTDDFVTMFYGILDFEKKEFLYSNAGHMPFIHYKKKEDKIEFIYNGKGTILGCLPNGVFDENKIKIEKDDMIFVYTDGIVEAKNNHKKEFGYKKLEEILFWEREKNIENIIDNLIIELKNFVGSKELIDDVSILGVKIK